MESDCLFVVLFITLHWGGFYWGGLDWFVVVVVAVFDLFVVVGGDDVGVVIFV